ncbi:MAG: DoxX family protein [Flavipsychrobacter sp.]|nr:DoxX family protein [Flavipsychrobacter sp.]
MKWKFWFYLMVLLYVVAGVNHFINTPVYMSIMPPWLPYPKMLVYISGICEALFGILLLPVSTRRIAAWLIILLLIAVFPANIQTTLNYGRQHDIHFWISAVRLPLQMVLIWWAWLYTKPREKKGALA